MSDTACPCFVCDPGVKIGDWMFASRMNVCPDCGNKRCPKAARHDNECTGSNEPGQHGSRCA